jgi:drug/metabolite transporter (DMT)-like permease
MNWFVLALIAPLLWACGNLLDDHLLKNVFKNAAFAAVIAGVFGSLPAIYIYWFSRPSSIAPKLILYAISAGILTVLFYYFYFRTLESDEPSVAIALNNITPVIVLFLAFFILHEKLRLLQYLGVSIIITSSFALSAINIKKFKFSRSIEFASYGAVAYALAAILAKYSYERASFTNVYFWISIGYGIAGIAAFLLLRDRRQFRFLLSRGQKRIAAILIGAELINTAGELVQGAAMKGGPVTIVRALEGIQPLYVLLLGVILAQFFPLYFRERRDQRFRVKIICMIFMVAGLFML